MYKIQQITFKSSKLFATLSLLTFFTSCEEPAPPSKPLVPPVCGNGILEMHEACDDGNLVFGDGCDTQCLTEFGYTCAEPGQNCKINICDHCSANTSQTHAFLRSYQRENCHCPDTPISVCEVHDRDFSCGNDCIDCTVFGAVCQASTCVCQTEKESLVFKAFQNTTTDLKLQSPTYPGETDWNPDHPLNAVNALPYHVFEVNTGHTPMIEINYEGTTQIGERLALYVWHPIDQKWIYQTSAVQQTEDKLTIHTLIDTQDFVQNSIVKFLAAPYLNANGADSFAFTGDTQNYTSSTYYIDGHSNGIYNHVTTWVRNQYLDGKIAYMHHAGDVVSGTSGTEYFQQEFDIADEAHRILEDAGVPYGITPGNHDIYLNLNSGEHHIRPWFDKTFNSERFQDFLWFYPGPEGYHTHYILATIAERDFIFVNVGYDVYPYDWINEILARYPHRIAVFSTHVYLSNGKRTPQANRYHKNVVVPNDNVEIVLSGHISKRIHATDSLSNGRKIHQITVDHSNYHEDGAGAEGYIRLIRFADDKMYHTTYSPYRDEWLTDDNEQFTLDFPLRDSVRTLQTHHFSAKVHCVL